MRLGKGLRGIVSAVAAVALALAMAPASARAVTLTNGTATVTGVSGATTVELYKVADIADTNDDNVLEVSPLYSFTVADYEQNPAAVANAIASQVTGDPDYTATPSGDTATFTDVEPGLYLVRVVPEETESLAIEEGRDLVTLVTCTPYGVNTHRLLVHAERCELPAEWSSGVREQTAAAATSPGVPIAALTLLGVAVVAGLGASWALARRAVRRRPAHMGRRARRG